MLIGLSVSKQQSDYYFRVLKANIDKGTKVSATVRGHQSVTWHKQQNMWSRLHNWGGRSNQYWCAFGVEDKPSANSDLRIDVEINPSRGHIHLNNAGQFAASSINQKIHLCHTGRFNNPGATKDGFLKFYDQNIVSLRYTTRSGVTKSTKVIDFGPIDSTKLRSNIARFVRAVKEFKQITQDGQFIPKCGARNDDEEYLTKKLLTNDEFDGVKKFYRIPNIIKPGSMHGKVQRALSQCLKSLKLDPKRDRFRDTYVNKRDDDICYLFEIKTDSSRQSIYTAVGQLMIYSHPMQERVKLLLVLPDQPKDRSLKEALKSLNVSVLLYTIKNNKPTIRKIHLKRALGVLDRKTPG